MTSQLRCSHILGLTFELRTLDKDKMYPLYMLVTHSYY